jgi:serine/threonine protein kinase
MNSSQFDTDRRPGGPSKPVALSPTKGAFKPRSARVYEFSYSAGQRLGRELVVTDPLSAGPFTEIYRVWSEERFCALACKVLRPGLESGDPHRRILVREYAVLRRLTHPSVVRVFPPDPSFEQPHLLMEHLAGPSLLDLLGASPKRRLKPQVALRIAVGIGSALEAVHQSGYLYRDLKPANVIMRDGSPVLVDFGAVYHWSPGRRPSTRVGTDPYMAPEQCLGHPLSPRTDVFGLGAITYEMLTGEWPFEDQLMNVFDRTKLHNRFPQIAHAPGTLRRRVAGIGEEVERVVHRCLARDPARRYASAAEAVAELNRLLDDGDQVFPADFVGGSDRAA